MAASNLTIQTKALICGGGTAACPKGWGVRKPFLMFSVLIVLALTALTAYLVITQPFYDRAHNSVFLLCTASLWVLFALGFIVIRRVPVRQAVVVILIGSALIGGAAMAGPPNTSTDSARYAWDGIVQNAGISPYRYIPVADAVGSLRPDWLFPAPALLADGHHRCAEPRTHFTSSEPSGVLLCTAINRSKVPTIYPPTAELFFAAVRFVVGPSAQYWPLQLTGLLMTVSITALLIGAAFRRGLDPRFASLWAFSPLVATEAITNSHIDVLGGLLVLVATLFVSRGRRFRGGIALGASIATKLIPIIAAPALLRRQPWKVVVAAVVTFVALYVPYVLTTGIGVLGYLPGYLTEEGYSTGSRLALVSLLVPAAAVLPVAAVLLAITAVLVWLRTNPASPWLGQLVMIGVTLLIVAPRYPWYALLLIPFIALTGRWEWSFVALALSVRQLLPATSTFQLTLGIAVVVILGMLVLRRRGAGRGRAGRGRRGVG